MTLIKPMKLFLLLLTVLLFSHASYSQSKRFNGSVIIEGVGLLTEVKQYSGTWPNNDATSYQIKSGLGIYWSAKWNLDSLYQLELRPGWFLSSEYFRSLQIGLYVRRAYGENYFGAIGISALVHYGGSGRTVYPDGGNYELNISVGRKLSDVFLLIGTIGKTINENYGGTKLFWVAKLGLEVDI